MNRWTRWLLRLGHVCIAHFYIKGSDFLWKTLFSCIWCCNFSWIFFFFVILAFSFLTLEIDFLWGGMGSSFPQKTKPPYISHFLTISHVKTPWSPKLYASRQATISSLLQPPLQPLTSTTADAPPPLQLMLPPLQPHHLAILFLFHSIHLVFLIFLK